MVKAVTQTAPDVEIGWSRRRHASRRRSGGVRHNTIYNILYYILYTTYIQYTIYYIGPYNMANASGKPVSCTLHSTVLLSQHTPLPFYSRSRRSTPTYADGTLLRFTTWGCSGHTSSFHQENNKQTKCSLTFPLKNGPIIFYVHLTNTYVIVNKREGVVSTPWVPMVFYV